MASPAWAWKHSWPVLPLSLSLTTQKFFNILDPFPHLPGVGSLTTHLLPASSRSAGAPMTLATRIPSSHVPFFPLSPASLSASQKNLWRHRSSRASSKKSSLSAPPDILLTLAGRLRTHNSFTLQSIQTIFFSTLLDYSPLKEGYWSDHIFGAQISDIGNVSVLSISELTCAICRSLQITEF